MFLFKALPGQALTLLLSLGLLASCIHKKYDTPIAKNTQQPDKVLFDSAVKDIEHGRYEVARISLQTLMNTYESSEFMAKAKLAIADSWYREGGSTGMAQAEAEYKDFILFYPQMEESAEAQNRVCDIHYKQMEGSDRDWTQTLRAETECRQVLEKFPNSKFAPQAIDRLRKIQESLAAHEFVVGNFYWKREMNPAAANRLEALVDQYPLFSLSGEALYEAGDSYSKMGTRFRKRSGEMFSRLVRDYPLSPRAKEAKLRLEDLEVPVPAPDPGALARAKYEQENYHRPGMMARASGLIKSGPNVSHAASSGAPTMTPPKSTIPASVPVANNDTATTAGAATGGGTNVTATPVGPNSALEKNPDARTPAGTGQAGTGQAGTGQAGTGQAGTGQAGTDGTAATGTPATPAQPLPTNRDKELRQYREKQQKKQDKLNKKKKKSQDGQVTSDPNGQGAPVATTPDASPTAPAGTAGNVTVAPGSTPKQPPTSQPQSQPQPK